MSTYLIIRDGQIRLRLPNARIINGKIAAPAGKSLGYVLDGELAKADGVLSQIAALAKARRWSEIDAKYLAGPGTSPSGLLVIEQAEYRAQQDAKLAQELYKPMLDFDRRGTPVIIVDARRPTDGDMELAGCRWHVTGKGDAFPRGPWQVRYLYVEFAGVMDHQEACRAISRLRAEEEERCQRELSAMMSDGDNDGVDPPRRVPEILAAILAQIEPAAKATVALQGRVARQLEASPASTIGFLQREAARKAKALLDFSANEAEIVAALESYRSDPRYAEAVLSD